jgi:hypothetical protein
MNSILKRQKNTGSAWLVASPRAPLLVAAWSEFGAGAGQDHFSGAGIMEANEQFIFAPFSYHRHPASGHPL